MIGLVLGLLTAEYAELVAVPISQGEQEAKLSSGELHFEQRDARSSFA